MNTISISTLIRVCWLTVALPLTTVSLVHARDLVSDSPFLPEGFRPPQQQEERPEPQPEPPRGPQPLDQLEFRGLTRVGGQLAFSLYDPTQERSFWIGPGESFAGFDIVEFNEDDLTVIISSNGRNRTVPMREAQVQVLEQPQESDRDRGRGRGRGDDDDNDQTAEERMEELAEEIRRRREVRRQLIEEAQQRNNNN